jgi:putative (di)nucleoside polyphosphate hydrolase
MMTREGNSAVAIRSATPIDGYRPNVGILLINRAGLVWVGRRADAPGDMEGAGVWWQMPQGGIDPGEDIVEAARRELREETGIVSADVLAVTVDWLAYDFPPEVRAKKRFGHRGQQQKWVAMRFTGQDAEIDITPPDPEMVEFDAWKWVAHETLATNIVAFKRDIYVEVVAEFSKLLKP